MIQMVLIHRIGLISFLFLSTDFVIIYWSTSFNCPNFQYQNKITPNTTIIPQYATFGEMNLLPTQSNYVISETLTCSLQPFRWGIRLKSAGQNES